MFTLPQTHVFEHMCQLIICIQHGTGLEVPKIVEINAGVCLFVSLAHCPQMWNSNNVVNVVFAIKIHLLAESGFCRRHRVLSPFQFQFFRISELLLEFLQRDINSQLILIYLNLSPTPSAWNLIINPDGQTGNRIMRYVRYKTGGTCSIKMSINTYGMLPQVGTTWQNN